MIETRKYGKEKIILLCGVFLVMTGLGMTLPGIPYYIVKTLKAKTMIEKKNKKLFFKSNIAACCYLDNKWHGDK